MAVILCRFIQSSSFGDNYVNLPKVNLHSALRQKILFLALYDLW